MPAGSFTPARLHHEVGDLLGGAGPLQSTPTRSSLKASRSISSLSLAEKAGINPYQREHDAAVRYLIVKGYVEPYPNPSRSLYRMTNKGLEEILGSP